MDIKLNEEHALKCELASEVLRSSGQLRLRVTGWSMLPTVWPGDTLLVERIRGEHACEGDIVLFGRDRRLVAHRVVATAGETTITQGDSMTRPDAPVSGGEILGRVSSIIRNGRCIEPNKTMSVSERAVAGLARHSESAARVIVGVAAEL